MYLSEFDQAQRAIEKRDGQIVLLREQYQRVSSTAHDDWIVMIICNGLPSPTYSLLSFGFVCPALSCPSGGGKGSKCLGHRVGRIDFNCSSE